MKRPVSLATVFAILVIAGPAAHASDAAADSAFALSFIKANCTECHGDSASEGDITLHQLAGDPATPADQLLWKKVFERLESGEMPPPDAEQPSLADRQQAMHWIKTALKAKGNGVDEFRALASAHGNWVDHDALFSGKDFGVSGTPSRVWRLTPESYLTLMKRLNKDFNLGLNNPHASSGLSIGAPWALPRKWDFQDYSSSLMLTDPELDQHLNNCIRFAERMTKQFSWNESPVKKIQPVLSAGKSATPQQIEDAVTEMFDYVLHLKLEPEELKKYCDAFAHDLQTVPADRAVTRFVVEVLHHPEVLYRLETPRHGEQRSIMPAHQLARSISFGLTDDEPDQALLQAVAEGKLETSADVKQQVERILNDPTIAKPRVLGFFRNYFGYQAATDISKERVTLEHRLGHHVVNYDQYPAWNYVYDTDRLVEWVLASDQQVLRTLLTTTKTYILASFTDEWDRQEVKLEAQKKRDAEVAARENAAFDPEADKYKVRREEPDHYLLRSWRQTYGFVTDKDTWYQSVSKGVAPAPSGVELTTEQWYKGGPFDTPPGQRMGILTQPSWLIAMSSNFDNHAIHRGRWIRERLLGGRVPEVPITVNAMLPDEPHNTLRERMRVTREEYCWTCHKSMDPLGLSFEQYDHIGRFRTVEIVQDDAQTAENRKNDPNARPAMKTVPYSSAETITDSGDPAVDGEVKDAFELIGKLANSERVEQVFVRHAFRYFLGRNETLADGPVIVAAHKAYRDSNGSFKALLVSLLTSDAFLYRIDQTAAASAADTAQR